MGDDAAGPERAIPWALQNADLLGLGLIVLMVGLVVWRAATRQPVSGAEALIGVVGLIALTLPLLTNVSLEGFGVKFSATVQSIQKTSGSITEQIAVLNQQNRQNAEKIEALAKLIVIGTDMSPAAGPDASGPDRTGSDVPGSGATGSVSGSSGVSSAPKSEVATAVAAVEAVPPAKDYSVLVYYRDGQRDRATKVAEALIDAGYYSSATLTDLSEVREPASSGQIRVVYTEQGRDALAAITSMLSQRFGEGSLVVRDAPMRLVNGDLQIQFF